MSTNALRSYVRELRLMQGITQKELADAMGVSFRTVLEWEAGRIDELKSVPLTRAIDFLHGAMSDVSLMILQSGATADTGRELAHKRFASAQQDAAIRNQHITEQVQIFGRYLSMSVEEIERLSLPNLPLRAGNRLYEGERVEAHGAVTALTVNGLPFSAEFTNAYTMAFPDVEWGYSGRGPERLGYVLIAYESDMNHALHWSHRFLADVTARLPRNVGGTEWSLHSSQIQLWLRLTKLLTTDSRHAR